MGAGLTIPPEESSLGRIARRHEALFSGRASVDLDQAPGESEGYADLEDKLQTSYKEPVTPGRRLVQVEPA